MRWQWISVLIAVLVAATPLGREVIRKGFLSGEALSRDIARPLFFMGLALFA